jgi:2-polyprenyl-3-methyl-5-hydroxy-6-metoxy-1,4-benzoquinol methylase/uncharacterized protein YbaR (Trm112 family)
MSSFAVPSSRLESFPLELLACPVCHASLQSSDSALQCTGCSRTYPVDGGIPQLFVPDDPNVRPEDVTDVVKAFYEEHPFPNYDDIDSDTSLAEKAQRGVLARLMDDQIPRNARVLEVGCGTGQLSNFLGMQSSRRVVGSDMCLHSLRLAKEFRDRWSIRGANFMQMNLFKPALKTASFDVVMSMGVLHHTADPKGAFESIARVLKPGGVIIIGLYNKIGRLPTDMRRFLFRVGGDALSFLDSHMRDRRYNEERKRAWFLDQYKHPHESKHTFSEVIEWFEGNGIEYLSSVPKIEGGTFTDKEKLFEPHPKGTKTSRFFTDLEMLLTGGEDGALFVTIGRKLPEVTARPDTTTLMAQKKAS